MRTALTAAGYAGQQLAERRREQQQVSEEQARRLQARYDAERGAARSQVTVVHRDEWWEHAAPEKVAQMWQTAHGWRGEDPDVDAAARVMEDQVRQRFGVDPGQIAAQNQARRIEELRQAAEERSQYESAREWARTNDPDLYREHEARMMGSDSAVADRRSREELVQAWRERTGQEGAAAADRAGAAAVLAEPAATGVEKVKAEDRAGVLYDSAERRQQLADRLTAADDGAEAAEARTVADVSQGVPSSRAIARAAKAPKARPNRSAGRQQDKSLSR